MRRLVRHGLAGAGAATFAVVAGVTAFSTPASSTLAVPAVTTPPPSAVAAVDPQVETQRGSNASRENRDAERARLAEAAAGQRAADLGSQSSTIDRASDAARTAQAKAAAAAAARAQAAAAAKAKAAAAAKAQAAAAAAKKAAAVKAQGYTAGTSDPRSIAQQILANKFGYGADQFACFSWIISRESGWNVQATNASSGAYGLPQSLPGSKMASVASDWRTNPATQIIWGAQYMKDRYGSPCGAQSYWMAHGNY